MSRSNVIWTMMVFVLLLTGLGLIFLGFENFWMVLTSSRWPTATGSIKSSKVEEYLTGTSTSQHRSHMYSAAIVFEYRVDGNEYLSDTVYFGGSSGSENSSEAETLHLRYPQGSAVNIYYNSAHPETAVLEPGIQYDVFWLPGFGLTFLVAGLAFWIARRLNSAGNGWVYIAGYLIAAGLFFAGAAMLAIGILDLKRGWESRSWPVIGGIMVCSPEGPESANLKESEDIETRRRLTCGTSRSTGLVYGYEIEGKKHYGRVRRFGDLSLSNYRNDPVFKSRYAIGKPVRIAYSRQNPVISVLEPGVHGDAYWIPALGAFLLLAGLLIGLFAIPTLARIRTPEPQEWMRKKY